MNEPVLSVITVVLDGERFIESCIQSVIAQKCDGIEHLILDGGSKDRTVDIIKKYAQDHPHIQWISQKDDGQSDAMNKGIALARGRYVSFLNTDDYYEPNTLNVVLEILETLPEPGILVGNCNVWDDQGKLIYVNRPERPDIMNIMIGGQFPVNPSAYFYHRSLHEYIGGYDTDEHYAMDVDFIMRAIDIAHVRYVNRTFGNFRLARCTKTFKSMSDGRMEKNRDRVYAKYRRQLPWLQQLYIVAIRAARYAYFRGCYFAGRMGHYWQNPDDIKRVLRIPGLTV